MFSFPHCRRCALVSALLICQATTAQEYRSGQEVIIAEDGSLMENGNVVGGVRVGQRYHVRSVNGESLSLDSYRGFIHKSHVLPLSRSAIEQFTSLISKSPESAALYFARGVVWLHLEEYDIAIGDLTDAIRLRPAVDHYLTRASAWCKKHDYDRAIADADEAIKLNPNWSDSYRFRAFFDIYVSQYDNAIRDATQAIRLAPKNDDAYARRAQAWYLKGEYQQAVADISAAIRLQPSNASYYRQRAYMRPLNKECDLILADISEAIRLAPDDSAGVYLCRARIWFDRQDYSRAIHDCTEAIRCESNNTDAYLLRAKAFFLNDDQDRALDDISEAIRIKPDNTQLLLTRADFLLEKTQLDPALIDINAALKLSPKFIQAYRKRVFIWFIRHEYDKFVGDLKTIIELDPRARYAYVNLACHLATCPDATYRDGKRAVEYGHKACELTLWKDDDAVEKLALGYAESGDFSNAKKYLNMAISLNRGNHKELRLTLQDLFDKNQPYHETE